MTARSLMYGYVFVPLFLLATIVSLWQLVGVTYAAQSTTTLRPNSTTTAGWATVGGTPGGSCSGHCDYVDETLSGGNGDGDGSYVQTAAVQVEQYGMQDVTGGERATNVKIRAYNTRTAAGFGGNLQVNLIVSGAAQTVASQTWSGTNGVYVWFEANYAGTWTQADINSIEVWVNKTNGLAGATYRLSTVEAVVTWESPSLDQYASRAYLNQNNIQPSTPLAATNTVAEVAQNTSFRIRMGIQGSYYNWLTGSWGAHSNQYKLQYAQKSAGSCSAQASGWGDVTGATPIRYFNNATPADGAAISSNANDPDTGGSTKIYQSYEEANPIGLTNQVDIGQTGIWDFSLENAGSINPGTAYCLRIIQNDGMELTSYTAASYPEVLITGDYSLAIVDGSGVEVTTPTVVFPTGIVSNTQCASSSATLGTSTQKIRITNDLLTNGWNATIAATDGATAKWTAGSRFYDFNDPTGTPAGCGDGGDGDAYSGQLTVTPSSATITPEAGCSNTGVTTGSAASFNEGTTDAITLISASSGSTRFCYWDVTGIPLGQYIPMSTPAGTYSLDMTITVMNGA